MVIEAQTGFLARLVGLFMRVAAMGITILWLTGCADQMVTLRYTLDSQIEPLPTTQGVTVFKLADRRGDEGDHGDPLRVGGIYNGYGTRYAKIMTSTPWPEVVVQDLVAALTARGVQAVAMANREYLPGAVQVSTPLILSGEVRNFSSETRWLGRLAHVSGIVRLYDQQGTLLVEKPISARVRPTDPSSQPGYSLEDLLNEAVQRFVRLVVMDSDLSQRVVTPR
jgi:hypothetical protein